MYHNNPCKICGCAARPHAAPASSPPPASPPREAAPAFSFDESDTVSQNILPPPRLPKARCLSAPGTIPDSEEFRPPDTAGYHNSPRPFRPVPGRQVLSPAADFLLSWKIRIPPAPPRPPRLPQTEPQPFPPPFLPKVSDFPADIPRTPDSRAAAMGSETAARQPSTEPEKSAWKPCGNLPPVPAGYHIPSQPPQNSFPTASYAPPPPGIPPSYSHSSIICFSCLLSSWESPVFFRNALRNTGLDPANIRSISSWVSSC